MYPKDASKVVSGVELQSTDTFRQRIRTPLGPQEVDITPFWADYHGKKARFTHMVPYQRGFNEYAAPAMDG